MADKELLPKVIKQKKKLKLPKCLSALTTTVV